MQVMAATEAVPNFSLVSVPHLANLMARSVPAFAALRLQSVESTDQTVCRSLVVRSSSVAARSGMPTFFAPERVRKEADAHHPWQRHTAEHGGAAPQAP